jgi:hypothetical protein
MAGRWLSFLLLVSRGSYAYQTTIERREIDYTPSLARQYQERDGSSGDENIGNVQNSQYVANITVGGGTFVVILGRSPDLLLVEPTGR